MKSFTILKKKKKERKRVPPYNVEIVRVGTGNKENQIAAHCSFLESPLAKYLTDSAMDPRVGQKGSRSN